MANIELYNNELPDLVNVLLEKKIFENAKNIAVCTNSHHKIGAALVKKGFNVYEYFDSMSFLHAVMKQKLHFDTVVIRCEALVDSAQALAEHLVGNAILALAVGQAAGAWPAVAVGAHLAGATGCAVGLGADKRRDIRAGAVEEAAPLHRNAPITRHISPNLLNDGPEEFSRLQRGTDRSGDFVG